MVRPGTANAMAAASQNLGGHTDDDVMQPQQHHAGSLSHSASGLFFGSGVWPALQREASGGLAKFHGGKVHPRSGLPMYPLPGHIMQSPHFSKYMTTNAPMIYLHSPVCRIGQTGKSLRRELVLGERLCFLFDPKRKGVTWWTYTSMIKRVTAAPQHRIHGMVPVVLLSEYSEVRKGGSAPSFGSYRSSASAGTVGNGGGRDGGLQRDRFGSATFGERVASVTFGDNVQEERSMQDGSKSEGSAPEEKKEIDNSDTPPQEPVPNIPALVVILLFADVPSANKFTTVIAQVHREVEVEEVDAIQLAKYDLTNTGEHDGEIVPVAHKKGLTATPKLDDEMADDGRHDENVAAGGDQHALAMLGSGAHQKSLALSASDAPQSIKKSIKAQVLGHGATPRELQKEASAGGKRLRAMPDMFTSSDLDHVQRDVNRTVNTKQLLMNALVEDEVDELICELVSLEEEDREDVEDEETEEVALLLEQLETQGRDICQRVLTVMELELNERKDDKAHQERHVQNLTASLEDMVAELAIAHEADFQKDYGVFVEHKDVVAYMEKQLEADKKMLARTEHLKCIILKFLRSIDGGDEETVKEDSTVARGVAIVDHKAEEINRHSNFVAAIEHKLSTKREMVNSVQAERDGLARLAGIVQRLQDQGLTAVDIEQNEEVRQATMAMPKGALSNLITTPVSSPRRSNRHVDVSGLLAPAELHNADRLGQAVARSDYSHDSVSSEMNSGYKAPQVHARLTMKAARQSSVVCSVLWLPQQSHDDDALDDENMVSSTIVTGHRNGSIVFWTWRAKVDGAVRSRSYSPRGRQQMPAGHTSAYEAHPCVIPQPMWHPGAVTELICVRPRAADPLLDDDNVFDDATQRCSRYMWSCSYDGTVKMWDLRHRAPVQSVRQAGGIGCAIGASFVVQEEIGAGDDLGVGRNGHESDGPLDRIARLHPAGTDRRAAEIRALHESRLHHRPVTVLFAAAAGPQGVVTLWDATAMKKCRTLLQGQHRQRVHAMQLLRFQGTDLCWFATADPTKVIVWELPDMAVLLAGAAASDGTPLRICSPHHYLDTHGSITALSMLFRPSHSPGHDRQSSPSGPLSVTDVMSIPPTSSSPRCRASQIPSPVGVVALAIGKADGSVLLQEISLGHVTADVVLHSKSRSEPVGRNSVTAGVNPKPTLAPLRVFQTELDGSAVGHSDEIHHLECGERFMFITSGEGRVTVVDYDREQVVWRADGTQGTTRCAFDPPSVVDASLLTGADVRRLHDDHRAGCRVAVVRRDSDVAVLDF